MTEGRKPYFGTGRPPGTLTKPSWKDQSPLITYIHMRTHTHTLHIQDTKTLLLNLQFAQPVLIGPPFSTQSQGPGSLSHSEQEADSHLRGLPRP